MIGASVRWSYALAVAVTPMFSINPFKWLGEQAKETVAGGFTSMMIGLWSASMWVMQTAFGLLDGFVTPNVADPDLAKLYSVTAWISVSIALVLALGQIGLAVLRQDGRGFGTLVSGLVTYGLYYLGFVTVAAGLIAAAAGLTKGILQVLLGVDSFAGYGAGDGFVDTASGTVQATVLGVVGLFIIFPAGFGHITIMLVRSAVLLILTATSAITAAGALAEGTKSWPWKAVRWFLAAVLMSPLLALVLGLGTQFAWAGLPDGEAPDGSSTPENIGMSVVGSVIMLVACFTPLALFRLLAFVDPGTASGASFRATMNANGGVGGLMRGRRAGGEVGGAGESGAASETASDGRTSSENGAEAATANRWQSSGLARVGGKVGRSVGGAMQKTGQVAQTGAAIGLDVLGQSGVGNQGYYDTSYTPQAGHPPRSSRGGGSAAQAPAAPGRTSGGGGTSSGRRVPGRQGVANDLPPVAAEAVEEGVIIP